MSFPDINTAYTINVGCGDIPFNARFFIDPRIVAWLSATASPNLLRLRKAKSEERDEMVRRTLLLALDDLIKSSESDQRHGITLCHIHEDGINVSLSLHDPNLSLKAVDK